MERYYILPTEVNTHYVITLSQRQYGRFSRRCTKCRALCKTRERHRVRTVLLCREISDNVVVLFVSPRARPHVFRFFALT